MTHIRKPIIAANWKMHHGPQAARSFVERFLDLDVALGWLQAQAPSVQAQPGPTALPVTIAGLWGLCALVPFGDRAAYDEAAALCSKLAVRRLTTVQREYFRELLALVEDYEDEHGEEKQALAQLRRLAGASNGMYA